MAAVWRTGRRQKGFTLMELMLVLALLALLASLVAPLAQHSIRQARESALKEDLRLLRKGLDDYYADKGRYPPGLQDLVDGHYLRNIPEDPITGNSGAWVPQYTANKDQSQGVINVHSGAEEAPYKDW